MGLLREMVGFVAQRLMDFEVEALCGAGRGRCSDERTCHRNGYRGRRWILTITGITVIDGRAGAVMAPRGAASAQPVAGAPASFDFGPFAAAPERQGSASAEPGKIRRPRATDTSAVDVRFERNRRRYSGRPVRGTPLVARARAMKCALVPVGCRTLQPRVKARQHRCGDRTAEG